MEVGQPYDYFSSAQPYFCDFLHLVPDEHRAAVYLPPALCPAVVGAVAVWLGTSTPAVRLATDTHKNK